MKLEELIYKRFTETEELTKHLAVFMDAPAIFSPEAPAENQEGWKGETNYPMIVYNFDMQANEERNSAGTLTVSLLCQNTYDVAPEDIEPEVRKCLQDVLMVPDSGTPYCFAWARSDAFTIGNQSNSVRKDSVAVVIGSEIRFDILEYPSQETTDPDPITALNHYIKGIYPDSLVIGYDKLDEITEARGEHPIIYCRLMNLDRGKETFTVAWMDGRIAVHILCPEKDIRLKAATYIANQLSCDGKVKMIDKSPMQIKRLQANYTADFLKSGQLYVTVHYGLLKFRAKPHGLAGVVTNYH